MVVQNICDALIIGSGMYIASVLSSSYIFFGLFLTWQKLFLPSMTSLPLYSLGLVLSIFLVLLKILCIMLGTSFLYVLFFNNFSFVESIIPDVICFGSCLIGVLVAGKINPFNFVIPIKVLGFLALTVVSVLYSTIPGLFYHSLLVFQTLDYCVLRKKHMKFTATSVSIVSSLHLSSQCLFSIMGDFSFFSPENGGIIEKVLVFVLQFSFSMIAYCEKTIFVDQEFFLAEKKKEPTRIDKLVYAVLHILTIFFLWTWIIFFYNPVGLILMFWIFYSILQDDAMRLKKITKLLLLPTLVISLFIFYVTGLLPEHNTQKIEFFVTFKYTSVQVTIMFFTVLTVSLFYKHCQKIPEKLAFSSTVHGAIFTSLFKKMYIFSLVVLFLIGLSDINLLHTGLMILCIMFMINPISLKKYWVWLVLYTMVMLILRYFWQFVHQFIEVNQTVNIVLDIIGLRKSEKSAYISYDYLIWILLLSASIQHIANKIELQEIHNNHFLIRIFRSMYDYFSHIEIWIMYGILIVMQYLAPVNFLNLFRLVMMLVAISKHLYNEYNKIYKNYGEVYKYLVVLEVYSGILLAVRYVYQFLSFFPNAEHMEFPNLGFQVYNKKQLYTSTASDCCLLLVSVLASRNCWRLQGWVWLTSQNDIDKKNKLFYKYFSTPFQYIVIASIFAIAIFEKLSISMLINILSISVYQIYIAAYLSKGLESRESEWQSRAILWKMLFLNNIICLCLSYTRFLLNPEIIPDLIFNYMEWSFFVSGFTKERDSGIVLYHSYQYIIILVLLIIERHCLQYIYPPSLQVRGQGWRRSEIELNQTHVMTLKQIESHIDFIRALTLLKTISEALVPMLILLLAFEKITIVSVFYVFLVLLGFCMKDLSNTKFLYFVLIFLTIIQYTFILSNINEKTSKFYPESKPPIPIPWFKKDFFDEYEASYFLNLGIETEQLYSIFYDMLTQIFILVYYFYLANREQQLEELEILHQNLLNTTNLERIEENESNGGKRGEKSKIFLKDPSEKEDKKKKFSTTVKNILIYVKEVFYQFSRYLIVGIALLFITQSRGILSAFYCIFCLVFIIKENDIYLLQDISSYLTLLIAFLRFLVLDLTLQIFIQLPLTYVRDDYFEKMCQYVGLMKIVRTSEVSGEDLENKYLTILFKIYTFFIVYILYRMMKSKDYQAYIRNVFDKLDTESKCIALKMTKNFNNKRIKMNKFYAESKSRFNRELEKLEENIKIWNKIYRAPEKFGKKNTTFTSEYEKDSKKSTKFVSKITRINDKPERSLKIRINSFLIGLINPYLFENFVSSLESTSFCYTTHTNYEDTRSPERASIRERASMKFSEPHNRRKSKQFIINEYEFSSDNESSDSDDSDSSNISNKTQTCEEVNLNDSIEKDDIEYDFQVKHYLKIVVYCLASNTEALVYLSFFLNHWKYASLESIIFPLSAVGYSLIEYPRPPPRYFRYMLIYAEIIFFLKFSLQLEVWEAIFGKSFLNNYSDPFKIGLNIAKNTYSGNIIFYVLWDVLVMVALLLHNFYLIKVGLWDETERDIESLKQAKIRLGLIPQPSYQIQRHKTKKFLDKLLPKNKEEKPGKDFYFFTILIQMLILVYIFCFFTRMDGNSQDISQAIRSNQFQGRMVVSLIVQVAIIIIERYFYVNRASQALKDAQETEMNMENESFRPRTSRVIQSRFRSSTAWGSEIAKNAAVFTNSFKTMIEEQKLNDVQKDKDSERSLPLYVRVFIHIFLVISVHLIVFWYLPINGNIGSYGTFYCKNLKDIDRCNNFEVNTFTQIFYFLYLIYLVFAALQIKHSLPSFSKATFPIVRHASQQNYYIFKAYRKAPFLFEIRTLMDWIFTSTALNLYQWFKFEDIYSQLFINQCYQKSLQYKEHGTKVPKCEKCYMGVCGLFLLLIIILLPLMIFSTLNPIIKPNPVTSARLDVKFLFKDRGFVLYTIASAEEILKISQEHWNSTYNFNSVSQLTLYDLEIMNEISIPAHSDAIWTVSKPSREKICELLQQDIINSQNTSNSFIQVEYVFIRDYPSTSREVKIAESKQLSKENLKGLHKNICEKATSSVKIEEAFNQIIRLPSSGDKIKPIIIEDPKFKADLMLELVRPEDEGPYWTLQTLNTFSLTNDSDAQIKGSLSDIRFFAISDNYSEITLNFSILTFYISIVYVLGSVIKYSTIGLGMNVVMTDMKRTEDLQTLCEGIYISRMIGNLQKEEELYFELIDILRSPEITKMITGDSSIKDEKKYN